MESEAKWRDAYEDRVECAIQLVRLGADVNVRLELPTGHDARSEFYEMMNIMKLNGNLQGSLRQR